MDETVIFSAAIKLPAEQRQSFVKAACAGNAELEQEVAALLHEHDGIGSFIDQPAMPAAPTEPAAGPSERPGTQIGPYKLLQKIGEGGMGVVYMAEQTEPVERRVALKIIKPGMDTRQVIARFDAERQALAMMDHVNIARVLDVGTTEAGRPYFVMELVNGVPITKYCDDNRLTPRQRLELFVPVCQAIQHAHQKGIIHRDIKPSNVMVTLYDGKPVPKVIDFGVAKATEQKLTERTLFTQYGTMVGTLEYMSPEQAEMSALGVDTRSDIYSLGVLLYELLTGSTPLSSKRMKEAAYAEILRLIKEEEPPKPSTRLSDSGEALASISAQRHTEPAKLSKLVRGELDWIVMKTLEKDRNRRYETASGFAADVERYLNDEPVQACPPSAWYRFRKFARRHKAALVTAAAISIALVIGIVISTRQAIRATRAERLADQRLKEEAAARRAEEKQRRIADEQRQTAEQARQRATENLQMARQAVDQMLTEVGHSELANVPQMEPLRRVLLEKALQFYQRFLQGNPADPEIRLATGQAYQRIGGLYDRLGQYADADRTLQEAIRVLEGLVAESARKPTYEFALANAYQNLANILIHLRQWPKAEEAASRSLARSRKLAAEFPQESVNRNLLRNSLGHLGVPLEQLGRYSEAERAFREALTIAEQLVVEDPKSADFRRSLAVHCVSLEGVLTRVGRPEEAEGFRQRAVQIHEQLVSDFPNNPEYLHGLAHCRLQVALALRDKEQFQDAEREFEIAIKLTAKAVEDYPKTTQFRASLAESQTLLAELLRDRGRPEEAEPLYRQALENLMKLVAEAPSRPHYLANLRRTFNALIDLLRMMGKVPETETVVRQYLRLYDQLAADDPTQPAFQQAREEVSLRLIWLLINQALRPADAEAFCRERIELAEKAAESSEALDQLRYKVRLLNAMGWALQHQKRFAEAAKVFRQSAAAREQLVALPEAQPADRLELQRTYTALGVALASADQKDAAIEAYRRALALAEKLAADFPKEPTYQPLAAKAVINLRRLLRETGRLDEAEQYAKKLAEINDRLKKNDNQSQPPELK